MGPRLNRRGKTVPAVDTTPPAKRFNGATPQQAWKDAASGQSLVQEFKLQWGHASTGVESARMPDSECLSCPGFNGATPQQAWKALSANAATVKITWLQWGHASTGVERCWSFRAGGYPRQASMGPRLNRRGKSAISI